MFEPLHGGRLGALFFFLRGTKASQFGSPYIETEHPAGSVCCAKTKALTKPVSCARPSNIESIRKQIEGHTIPQFVKKVFDFRSTCP